MVLPSNDGGRGRFPCMLRVQALQPLRLHGLWLVPEHVPPQQVTLAATTVPAAQAARPAPAATSPAFAAAPDAFAAAEPALTSEPTAASDRQRS